MENNYTKETTNLLTKSLNNTQRNAVDTEKIVQQIGYLSGWELHQRTIKAILSDKDIAWNEKVDLILQINADYDQREDNNASRLNSLQTTQSQNVETATTKWGVTFGLIVGGVVLLTAFGTPGGRKAIYSAAKYLLAA